MRILVLVVLSVFSISCSSDQASNNVVKDTGVDIAVKSDASKKDTSVADLSSSKDMGKDSSPTDTSSDTALTDMADLVDADMTMADMGKDPFEGRPKGQCTQKSDCPDSPNGKNCGPIPGGACLGCGSDDHCPGDSKCTQFGACASDCTDAETDCAPGQRCLRGRCSAMRCKNDVCPVSIYGCSGRGICVRKDCSTDATICTTGSTCVEGFCVANRSIK